MPESFLEYVDANRSASLSNHHSYSLAIVGAGPRFVYAFERIAAIFTKKHEHGMLHAPLHLHVFDPSAEFGSGCHSSRQPASNWLNVVANPSIIG